MKQINAYSKNLCLISYLPTSPDEVDMFAPRRNNNMSTSSSSSSSYHIRNSSTGSNNDTIQLLAMTQGRRVQNSLQRLEKQQDEFFEL